MKMQHASTHQILTTNQKEDFKDKSRLEVPAAQSHIMVNNKPWQIPKNQIPVENVKNFMGWLSKKVPSFQIQYQKSDSQ